MTWEHRKCSAVRADAFTAMNHASAAVRFRCHHDQIGSHQPTSIDDFAVLAQIVVGQIAVDFCFCGAQKSKNDGNYPERYANNRAGQDDPINGDGTGFVALEFLETYCFQLVTPCHHTPQKAPPSQLIDTMMSILLIHPTEIGWPAKLFVTI